MHHTDFKVPAPEGEQGIGKLRVWERNGLGRLRVSRAIGARRHAALHSAVVRQAMDRKGSDPEWRGETVMPACCSMSWPSLPCAISASHWSFICVLTEPLACRQCQHRQIHRALPTFAAGAGPRGGLPPDPGHRRAVGLLGNHKSVLFDRAHGSSSCSASTLQAGFRSAGTDHNALLADLS